MSILRVKRPPHAVQFHDRGALLRLLGIDHFHLYPYLLHQLGLFMDAFHPLLGLAQQESALVPKGKIQFRGQRLIEPKALQVHIAQQRHSLPHPPHGAGLAELPQPSHKVEIPAPFDVEGAVRVEHPAQALGDDPRLGQRYAVAGHNQPGVSIRTPRADHILFDHSNLAALFLEKVRRTDTDDSAADDQHIYLLRHSQASRLSDRLFVFHSAYSGTLYAENLR